MTDLVAIARKRDDRIKTHWEGCEEQHTECLISKMADEIERLRAAMEVRERDHREKTAEIDLLRELLRDARADVKEIADQQTKRHHVEAYEEQLAEIDKALS